MTLQMPPGQLREDRDIRHLFILCWLAYFVSYLGRLDYTACLAEIAHTQFWSKGEAGLVATAYYTAYGVGQLINGVIGDRLSPKYMVGCGIVGSALCNLFFPMTANPSAAAGIWCVNGFLLSMVWSPLLRLIAERMPEERRVRACVHMTGTVPVGTLTVYALAAVFVHLGNWKLTFYTSAAVLFLMALAWFTGVTRLDRQAVPVKQPAARLPDSTGTEHISFLKLALMSAIPLCALASLMQGMLKDGVTAWIPTFLEEQFGISAAGAILSTMLIPLSNLGGIYLSSWVDRHFFRNEIASSSAFFAGGCAALAALLLVPGRSPLFSLLMLAMTTTFMTASNTLVVGVGPSYFIRYGLCSTISGVLNSAVYLGSALSSYINGIIAEQYGWNRIIFCWCMYAAAGTLLYLVSIRRWKQYRASVTAHETGPAES